MTMTVEEANLRAQLATFNTPRLTEFKLALPQRRLSVLIAWLGAGGEDLVKIFDAPKLPPIWTTPITKDDWDAHYAANDRAETEILCAALAIGDEIDRRFPVPA